MPHPELLPYLKTADYVETKHIQSDNNLDTFMLQFFNYNPPWVRFLYGFRGYFVRLLGMRQDKVPEFKVAHLPTTVGEKMVFFEVVASSSTLWLAKATDKHLTAYLGAEQQGKTFTVYTLVKYHHWTGVFYFNVIRPFHHVVVGAMMHAAARSKL